MKNCILLSHIHVYPEELFKHDILRFSIKHYKKHNPDVDLLLTGHGVRPPNDILEHCDYVHWEDKVDESEIGRGHPRLVDIGVKHAVEQGYFFMLKNRADSIIVTPKIIEQCISVLKNEGRDLLVSYGTCDSNYWLGDLFTFCRPTLLKCAWDSEKWNYGTNGLENFGRGFYKFINPSNSNISWLDFLRENTVYRSPDSLGWVDLLGPHPHQGQKWLALKQNYSEDKLLSNDFDFSASIWGKDWRSTPSSYLTEEVFYSDLKVYI
jgi:hypothetical protein